jgi:hypothetical protein
MSRSWDVSFVDLSSPSFCDGAQSGRVWSYNAEGFPEKKNLLFIFSFNKYRDVQKVFGHCNFLLYSAFVGKKHHQNRTRIDIWNNVFKKCGFI